MSYGQVISEFRHYDYTEKSSIDIIPASAILKLLNEQQISIHSPPSYSAVLAEKKQQQLSNYDKSLDETNRLILFMKKTMKDTEIFLASYQHYFQRLELKNQYLSNLIKKEQTSDTMSSFDYVQSDQLDLNDSLNRMNEALRTLIQEARSSLDTCYSISTDDESCSTFDTQLLQQKRYLHSQWKLTIAMKQFIDTVQNNEQGVTTEPVTIHHHHHHHHHHYYYYHQSSLSIPEDKKEVSPLVVNKTLLLKSLSLSSVIKHAVNTVIPPSSLTQQQSIKEIESKPLKYQKVYGLKEVKFY